MLLYVQAYSVDIQTPTDYDFSKYLFVMLLVLYHHIAGDLEQ